MFEGITFVEFCNDAEMNGSSFMVAIRGMTEQDYLMLESRVYSAVNTMTRYDSLEERVGEIIGSLGLEYEIVYPDRYITAC